jgi:transposase InsO family protein
MVTQAHACVEQVREAGLEMNYLIHDRDGMYVKEFDQIFKDDECRVIRTAPQAPNQNAFIERWVRSIGDECLNHFLVFGKKHFDFLVASYLSHYNTARPHQGVGIGPTAHRKMARGRRAARGVRADRVRRVAWRGA